MFYTPSLKYKIYDFAVTYARAHCGKFPPVREIGSAFGTSTSQVFHHLDRMILYGMIVRDGNSYSIVGASWFPPYREYHRLNGGI